MSRAVAQVASGFILLLTAAACAGENGTTLEEIFEEPSPTATQYDANAALATVAELLPGFAGFARDPVSGSIKVFSTDPNMDPANARQVLDTLPGINLDTDEIIIVDAQYDYPALTTWYQAAEEAVFPLPPSVQFVYSDIDELSNSIVFAFADEQSRVWAETTIAAAGVPASVLRVILADPVTGDEGDD